MAVKPNAAAAPLIVTTAEGTVRYRKEATDSHKTVIGDWSDPVTVTAASANWPGRHDARSAI